MILLLRGKQSGPRAKDGFYVFKASFQKNKKEAMHQKQNVAPKS